MYLLALAALLPAFLAPEGTRAATCPAAKSAKLSLKIQTGEVRLDHSRDLAGMRQVSNAFAGYTQGQWHIPLGLTVGELNVHYATRFSFRQALGGTYCVSLVSAEITVGDDEIDVYVSRDYAEGSCEYETVLAHELEHVAINQRVLKAYTDQISTAFARTARSRPSILVHRKSEAQAAYIRELELGLRPVLKVLAARRSTDNGKIDTQDNYRRLTAKCGNW